MAVPAGARSRERGCHRVEVDGTLGYEDQVDPGGTRDRVGEVAVGCPEGLEEEGPAGQRATGHAQLLDRVERQADRRVHADGGAGAFDVLVDRRRDEGHGEGVGKHPRAQRGAVAADHDQAVEAEGLERLDARVAPGRGLERLPAARAEPGACLVRARLRLVAGHRNRAPLGKPREAALDAAGLAADALNSLAHAGDRGVHARCVSTTGQDAKAEPS